MSGAAILFYPLCIVILGSASTGLITRRGTRTSVAWFLLSMSALAGVFILQGAHVIAIAQLFFCAGLGLVSFFAIDASASDAVRDDRGSEFGDWASPASHWLIVTLGIAGASFMLTTLFGLAPDGLVPAPEASELPYPYPSSFQHVGVAVLVDHGVALLCVGLLLLAAVIGAGYLTRRGAA